MKRDAGRYVCANCITDPVLEVVVRDAAENRSCTYCGRSPAADFDVVTDAVTEAIESEYEDPANMVPYETAEGGYQGSVLDGYELAYELGDWTDNEKLLEDVAVALVGNAYSRKHFFSLDDFERLNFSWRDFVEQIKHRTRYLFLEELGEQDPDSEEIIPPGRMLTALGKLFLEYELFQTLPAGTILIRARVVDQGKEPHTVEELGAPPRERARSNRMSPAGIPMFYAAFSDSTAVLETVDPERIDGRSIVLGTFVTTRDLIVLDLSNVPKPPSRFDIDNRHNIPQLGFLRDLVEDLTEPVSRDEREHVDYVPTQVVTEYVRHRLKTADKKPIGGLVYRSSRPKAELAVVLFADPEQCGVREEPPELPVEPLVVLKEVRIADPKTLLQLWS